MTPDGYQVSWYSAGMDTLPDHDANLVDEVGEYFTWAWPFFEASMTGTWPSQSGQSANGKVVKEEEIQIVGKAVENKVKNYGKKDDYRN